MAITLTGTGGIFTRLGKLAGGINEANTARATTLTARVEAIDNQYEAAQQSLVDSIYGQRDSFISSASSWLTYLQQLAQDTLITQANADTALSELTLTKALELLISQMTTSSDSINRPTISATVTDGTNTGTGKLVTTTTDGDGKPLDYQFAETITAKCTADGYTAGGGTAGQETFTITSPLQTESVLDEDWPQGSGTSVTVNALDATLTTGLLLTDGNFENWGGSGNNTPTNWDITTGTAGTTVFRSSSPFTGSYALQFTGNGSELTAVRQTVANLQPKVPYLFNCWVKTDGSVAAGVLNIRLIDGGGSAITDAQGGANSISLTLSAATSSYVALNGVFRLPAIVPDTVKVEIRLSTAATNTEVIVIDTASLQEMTQLYDGGPYVGICAGAVDFAINDSFSIAAANNLTTTSFARSLDRLFDLRGLGLKIPSAASETLSDSLIS